MRLIFDCTFYDDPFIWVPVDDECHKCVYRKYRPEQTVYMCTANKNGAESLIHRLQRYEYCDKYRPASHIKKDYKKL